MFSEQEWQAIFLSLQVATISAIVSVPFALALGWLLARKTFRGKIILEGLVQLPLVLPPVTTGYLLLLLFGVNGYIGGFLYEFMGIRISFTFGAAVLASVVVSFPLFVRSVRIAIEMVDVGLEHASRTLGMGRFRTFLRVTLPLAMPGIAAGLVLSFARSLGEFGATVVFAGNIVGSTQTIPLAIYSYMEVPALEQSAMRLVLASVAISLVAMVAAQWLQRKTQMIP